MSVADEQFGWPVTMIKSTFIISSMYSDGVMF